MHDADGFLTSMSKLAAHNTLVSASVSARALVLGKFLEVAMSQLTAAQCRDITPAFKQGIEDIMTMMDDMALPQAFHSEFLSLTNTIIDKLGHRHA